MSKKNALITGANKGIGFEIVRQLGRRGYHVFLTARDGGRGEEATRRLRAEGLSVDFIQLDVADEASINRAFQEVSATVDRLDALVNNAAVLLDEDKPFLSVTNQEIRDTFDINALGVLFVTRAFLPLLKAGSRVVNVSSSAGAITGGMGDYAPLYSVSKTAENAITIQLARALKGWGVLVNAVCPGWVRTDMGGRNASRSVEKGAETPVWLATEATQTGLFFRDKKVIPW